MPDSSSPPRRPLHERSNSHTNTAGGGAIRLVPSTPPQLLGQPAVRREQRDDIYSRTPLPTHPSHILGPGKPSKTRGTFYDSPVLDESFHSTSTSHSTPPSSGSSHSTTRTVLQPARNPRSATPSPTTKPKAPARKRLSINKDGRTFSLLQDDPQPTEDGFLKSPILSPISRTSFDSVPSYASTYDARASSIGASLTADEDSALTTIPGTPESEHHDKSFPDPLGSSPENYQLVGGIRKVPRTPEFKQKATSPFESPLPPCPEVSDAPSHDLSAKPSFQSSSTSTSTSTTSENSNYKVYRYTSPSLHDDAVAAAPSFSDSNYHILEESPSESSVIYRPQAPSSEARPPSSDLSRTSSFLRPDTSRSEDNYELHGEPSPSPSFLDHPYPSKYSQESLVVPALKPRSHRSNEKLGYYKSRSRESLRSRSRAGSLSSISTVLSHREAIRAVVNTGFLVNLPAPKVPPKGPSSWAEPAANNYPQRSYMNEQPHQWSSQLSTVLSVSDGGSERNSRSLSDVTGRRSGGYASTPSRNSRPVLSVGSSSFAQEDLQGRNDWIEPPQPVFSRSRSGQRHQSVSSIRMIESQDEYGDGITDLQDLRSRTSRGRLSGFYSIGSENGRTNTMRSASSTRSNSLVASSIPAWAMLYYGSGERRFLGAPGSSIEGLDSRASSFRSGSPNPDTFPSNIYSPRRRPREGQASGGRGANRGSLEITQAPDLGNEGNAIESRYVNRFRRWSMSSTWSPHLRIDRRAARLSVWEPPSVSWSTEGSWFGRRNVQIIMFIAGFLFPFTWMIASLLPLPPKNLREMQERDSSTSNLGTSNDIYNDYERQHRPAEDARRESARWWRRLNRWMSLVGIVIIAVMVILVVVSLRDGW